MDNNTNEVGTVNVTETAGTENQETTITLTQEQLNKKIQSETDKVRTKYSNDIKVLQDRIKELTPVEKSQAEIDFENRLAALEAREKKLNLHENLKSKGISDELADYLKDDVDVEALSNAYKKIIDEAVSKKVKNNGYVPNGHKSGDSITKDDFNKMSMDEKERLYSENPDLYKTLVGQKI